MRRYLYISIACFAIAIMALWFLIGCASLAQPDCSARTVADSMTMMKLKIPCRIAVGYDHVATQILKDGKWEFLHREDRHFEVMEYVTLQEYFDYLIVYYDTLYTIR